MNEEKDNWCMRGCLQLEPVVSGSTPCPLAVCLLTHPMTHPMMDAGGASLSTASLSPRHAPAGRAFRSAPSQCGSATCGYSGSRRWSLAHQRQTVDAAAHSG